MFFQVFQKVECISFLKFCGFCEFLRHFEPADFVIVFQFEIRRNDFLILRQETTGLFAVTSSSFGFCAEVFIYIESNAFVDGAVFLGKEVIILVIGVKKF